MDAIKYYDAGPDFAEALELLRPSIIEMINKDFPTVHGLATPCLNVTVGGVEVQLQLRVVKDTRLFIEKGNIFVIHNESKT